MGKLVYTAVMNWEEMLGAKRMAHQAFREFRRDQQRFLQTLDLEGRLILAMSYRSKSTVHSFTHFAWYAQPKGSITSSVRIDATSLFHQACSLDEKYEVDGVKAASAGQLVACEILPFLSPIRPDIKEWCLADHPQQYNGCNVVTHAFAVL